MVAGIPWDKSRAHSAVYDAERTADLFCFVCNELSTCYVRASERAQALGWHTPPLPPETDAEADAQEPETQAP